MTPMYHSETYIFIRVWINTTTSHRGTGYGVWLFLLFMAYYRLNTSTKQRFEIQTQNDQIQLYRA